MCREWQDAVACALAATAGRAGTKVSFFMSMASCTAVCKGVKRTSMSCAGTGKTLVARALAATASRAGTKVSFFMRKGADVLSKWVGEAERQLRLLFEEAQKAQPAIIFFDEIDGLAPVSAVAICRLQVYIVCRCLCCFHQPASPEGAIGTYLLQVTSGQQELVHNSIASLLLALMPDHQHKQAFSNLAGQKQQARPDPQQHSVNAASFDGWARFSGAGCGHWGHKPLRCP